MLLKSVKIVQSTSLAEPFLIINEMQIINVDGTDIATGGSPFGQAYITVYDPSKAFDKSIAQTSIFYSQASPGYLGYLLPTAQNVVAIKLYTHSTYASYRLQQGKVYGSLNTSNGVDGTWELLAEASMEGADMWCTFVLEPQVKIARKVQSFAPLLSAMPAALNRGFR